MLFCKLRLVKSWENAQNNDVPGLKVNEPNNYLGRERRAYLSMIKYIDWLLSRCTVYIYIYIYIHTQT